MMSRMMCMVADGNKDGTDQIQGNFDSVQLSETINISDLINQAGIKNDEKLVLRMLLSHRKIGELLGEGGKKLKNIQEQYQCVIKFSDSNNRYPGSRNRVMEITGNAINLFKALQQVFSVIHQVQQNFPYQNSDDDVQNSQLGEKFFIMPFFNVELTGSIIGKAGQTFKDIQKKTKVDIEAEYSENVVPGCLNRILWIRGDPDNVLHALIEIIGKIHETESYKIFSNTDLFEHTELGWLPQFLFQLRKFEFFKSEEVAFKLSVEKQYMNKIKEKIQDIAKLTLCNIKTQQKEAATDLVVVQGSFLNSMRAKALIAQAIKQQRVRSGQTQIREGMQRQMDIK